MIYVGIDVGKSGAIAVVGEKGELLEVHKTPEEIRDFIDLLEHIECTYLEKIVYLEKIHSFPGNSHKVAFTFGETFGITKACLVAANVDYIFISPQKWMNYYGWTRGDFKSSTAWKGFLFEKAQEFFPNSKITLYKYMGDALLIAYYCYLINKKDE